MKRGPLGIENFGIQMESEATDVRGLSDIEHLQILYASHLIHQCEQVLTELQKKGLLWGALHTSFGMETSASAALQALGKNSRINSTHRGHHHVLAKGLFSLMDENWNPLEPGSAKEFVPVVEFLNQTIAEILGLKIGCCSGRGGSMHLYDPSVGVHGTNGIVGGAIPSAVGLAFGAKHQKRGEIIMSFFGDGASNQGTFHESCNLAAIYKLPIIFFLENNQYAVGTKSRDVCSGYCLAARGISYGLHAYQVYADDPIAIHMVVREARQHLLSGGPPVLIEAVGYRPVHHDSPLPGSAYGYRTKEEEAYWAVKSGYEIYPKLLMDFGIVRQSQLDGIDAHIASLLDQAITPLVGKEKDSIDVKLWPVQDVETRSAFFFDNPNVDPFDRTVNNGMRSSGKQLETCNYVSDLVWKSQAMRETSYVQAIANVIGRWLAKDSEVYVWGEDVANFGQGPYGATKNLMHAFPNRVINTPISESGFVGMALGACMMGLKPIVEIMFPDFLLVAADQLFNQIGKARYMYGGAVDLPMVVRTRIATGTGMGPQHSMDPTALFSLFPGWRIIAPSNPADYIGLFNTAMRSNDPVLVLEHQQLYREKGTVPENMLDYCIPFGSAKVVLEGSDVTCVAYGGMVQKLQAAACILSESVALEIIDLRSLDAPSIDYETICASVGKTGWLLFFEEAPMSQSIGKQIIYHLQNGTDLKLKGKSRVVSSVDVPMPVSRPLEFDCITNVDDIVRYFMNWR
ncbi:MAG: MFS transporter [Spirochaetae bacterium HGW-Spirochaetae-2]|nr:MAG: MFS transporter [Spirochaetae bacterium HGW-Spirochaetae-2]